MRTLVNKEVREKLDQVCESYCFKCHPREHNDKEANHQKESITRDQLDSWMEHFYDEPFMVK